MMSLISFQFFVFIGAVLLLYYLIPLRTRWVVLLCASFFFYACSGWRSFLFVLCAGVSAYFAGLWIEKEIAASGAADGKEEKAARKKRAAIPLITGIVILLAMLFYSKVIHSLIYMLADTPETGLSAFLIIVPLGISYYTFSLIGYLADVYWKKDRAEHNLFRLLLYMTYFPHILQGPIPRHGKLGPQLSQGHTFSYRKFCFGLQRSLWGYFKKLVIADRLAVIVNELFGNSAKYEGGIFLVAIAASVFQLYTDFSGCMDIVIGISECFGIELEENFRRPFFSRSASEFWRRWHSTLGMWFKDYVYMPLVVSPLLAGIAKTVQNRKGRKAARNVMTAVPLAVVWLLTGLWHGTGPDYIVWGIYWGSIIILTGVFAPQIKKLNSLLHVEAGSELWKKWQMFRTFLIFAMGRLITAPGSLKKSAGIFCSILTKWTPWVFTDGTIYRIGLDRADYVVVLLGLLLIWRISCRQEQGQNIREMVAALPLPLRWILYYGLFFSIILFGFYGPGYNSGSFMYMKY